MNEGQRHLDQYELQQCLRRDTTSEVWKAFDTQQRRYVIITLLHFTLPTDEALPRFLRETRGLVALHHPHLVPIFEVRVLSRTTSAFRNSGEAYIVMDYTEGLSLADYLQTLAQARKVLSPAEIMHILAPIGDAIDYIHQQGIIHSLIRPSSILLDKNSASDGPLGEPRLVDLGMHNIYDPHQLSPNDVCYIAPEIIQGYTDNVRSDLYSLGIILYEVCTAVLPFRGSTTAEVISQQLNMMPPSPVLVNPLVVPELTAVIMRALAKDPTTRFPSASAMIQTLARALKVPIPQFSGQIGVEKSLHDSMHSPTFLSPLPQRAYSQDNPSPIGGQRSSASLSYMAQVAANNPQITPSITPVISASDQSLVNYHTAMANKQDVSSVSGSAYTAVGRTPQGQMTTSPSSVLSGGQPFPIGMPPPVKRKRGGLYIVLALLALLVLFAAGGGAWFLFLPPAVPQKTMFGRAFFVSSGLIDLTSSRGIADGLQVHLENVSAPQPGKSYYAWLLADTDDKSDTLPLLVGMLAFHNGQAMLKYAGDAGNSNLLIKYSRLLVTEEDASSQPVNPSLDTTTWRYSAAFSNIPVPEDGTNHFSLLDHLRHLLSQDPKLGQVGLVGGLDTWLYRNTLKILEWSGSARDLALSNGDTGLIRRQLVRILDYLDGSQFVQTENLPPDLPPVLVDPVIARVALLEIGSEQQPPAYLKHIGSHLREITHAPGVTPGQKQLASEINDDVNNVQAWLKAVRRDAAELIHKPADQLVQPGAFSLFNHMFTQANSAFVGQTDPYTGQVKEGVAQVHYKIQSLATFDITSCIVSKTGDNCV